jgi:regulatory protein
LKNYKPLSPEQAKEKMYRFCAYQERSHQEVKNKLFSLGVYKDVSDELITHLILEGYLNEERFAKAYAGGKFRIKQWGRLKITRGLEAKGVSSNCIRSGLKEIDDDDYQSTLRDVLEKKISTEAATNLLIKRDKISRHAIAKGFEPDLVWQLLKDLLPG